MNPEDKKPDQESTGKLTPEQIEQRNTSLEQEREKNDAANSEEGISSQISDVTKRIERKNEIIQDTQSKIDVILNTLGVSPSSEIPPSIKIEQQSIGELNARKLELENKLTILKSKAKEMTTNEGQKFSVLTETADVEEYKKVMAELATYPSTPQASEKETAAEVKGPTEESQEETKKLERNLKSMLEDMGIQSKTMFDALYERQQQGLTALQSNDNFQMMNAVVRNLKNFEGKVDANALSKITEDITKFSRMFDDIKTQGSGGQIRENIQNLEKLALGANRFSQSCEESTNKLPFEMTDKQMEEKVKELKMSLLRLSEQVKKLGIFARKLRSVF